MAKEQMNGVNFGYGSLSAPETLEQKEMIKAFLLAASTNRKRIPIVEVPVREIKGVTMHPYEKFWEHKAIDCRTPVILGRSLNVIGGPYQYFEAQESGQEYIKAVYIDSLWCKKLSLLNLKKQFKDKEIGMSFAYSLYACVSDPQDIMSFDDFCENAYVFNDINSRIERYIRALDRALEE